MKTTRSALYEMVWSKPRTVLAKDFGVSDVALIKRCRQANIPMPPRGYWAKVQAGVSRLDRPALPLRLPGSDDAISFDRDRYAPKEAMDATLEAPLFCERIQDLVDTAVRRLGHIRAVKDLSDPHPGLARVLNAEAERRKKHAENPSWSFYQPYFDDQVHQRQMRLVNALLHGFERLGCRGSMSATDQFVAGRGTTHRITFYVAVGDTSVSCSFAEPTGKPGSLALEVEQAGETEPPMRWVDEPHRALERQLDDIARGLLESAERRLRAGVQWRYEWAVKRKAEADKQQEERRQAAERARPENLERQRKLATDHLVAMAANFRVASEIRALVKALAEAPALKVHSPDSAFARWSAFALKEAARLDPSTSATLGYFEGVPPPPNGAEQEPPDHSLSA